MSLDVGKKTDVFLKFERDYQGFGESRSRPYLYTVQRRSAISRRGPSPSLLTRAMTSETRFITSNYAGQYGCSSITRCSSLDGNVRGFGAVLWYFGAAAGDNVVDVDLASAVVVGVVVVRLVVVVAVVVVGVVVVVLVVVVAVEVVGLVVDDGDVVGAVVVVVVVVGVVVEDDETVEVEEAVVETVLLERTVDGCTGVVVGAASDADKVFGVGELVEVIGVSLADVEDAVR